MARWGGQRWLGACVPEALDGMGHDALSTVLAFEAMGRAGVPRGQLFAVGVHLFGCAMGIARHGSDAQREAWCPRLSSGEAIGALAFTDPGGGSNLDACATAIRVEGDKLCLDGSKTFLTNGAHAERPFTDSFAFLSIASGARCLPVFMHCEEDGAIAMDICPAIETGDPAAAPVRERIEAMTRDYIDILERRWLSDFTNLPARSVTMYNREFRGRRRQDS